MYETIMESVVQVLAVVLITLLGVLGTWLTLMLNKKYKAGTVSIELDNINAAQKELIAITQQTVKELQQTVVDGLKAAHEDGKLTDEEIAYLKLELKTKVANKLSTAASNLLTAAGKDVVELITGVAESTINTMK